jgi:aldehyde dehydrogenase (NAD+)
MDLLENLNLKSVNPGAFSGQGWCSDIHQPLLATYNPTTNQKLADIATCSMKDYEQIIARSEHAAVQWRKVPAPKRGEIIRLMGQALREHKDSLGSLVSLEMGKSKQ